MRKPTPLKLAVVASGSYQKDVAAEVGLDPATFSRIVNGLWCDTETRVAIADALGRAVADLWPEHGDASQQPTPGPSIPASADDERAAA